jgi:NAD(P)-dependent dehydrogenase (short-subunit alcohol dehydrogenase family)
MTFAPDLSDRIALVAGGTRGAGRATSIELGAAGATVYVTGRTTETEPSPMARPETIEQTARLVDAAGGTGIAVQVDHTDDAQVAALMATIKERHGRLDVLVNDIWGGDPMVEWEGPFWTHNLANGFALLQQAVDTHLRTSWHAAPLLLESKHGLVVEVTDGVSSRYRGTLFYDMAKMSVIRLAFGQSEDFRTHNVAVVAVSPGFLRSEAMLEHFGVTEENWRDGIAEDEHFAWSETPHYVGRGIAGMAADPERMLLSGTVTASWELYKRYGFTDLDGTQPDWGAHARDDLGMEP